jgi:LysM repeat protein
MRSTLRKTFVAIAIALASLVIVVGIIALAMVQGGGRFLPGSSETETPTLAATELGPSENTATPEQNQTAQAATQYSLASCTIPKGWTAITVASGQTLEAIASQYGLSPESLKQANCLQDNIQVGIVIYVPATTTENTPYSTQSSAQCGPPYGWYIYTVQPGDTLYGIATAYGITVNQLMYANCLKNTNIYAGQRLYVPNVPPNYVNPGVPLPYFTPTPTYITIPSLLTPQTPMLPTGIPFPPP